MLELAVNLAPSEQRPLCGEWPEAVFRPEQHLVGVESPVLIDLLMRADPSTTFSGTYVMCPTSELPICPSGSPTYLPLASRVMKGYLAKSLSRLAC